MNSRWQANKIGLINFWYYDEQEFPFVKGRMLLRGSNGSGKSVTMQSVIPLLLDGNMSPERLDPFGSRDRKMSSYLLEEEDGREERTGYLYLEFRRQESETYLTIGMGIRARRGKPLDKWYFSLTDGRRVGKDFALYKDTGEKIPLSQKELMYRIQNGGRVFDRQNEYMEYVNQQIFGFETSEEYKELVDLLIQLRTPKLSKDFKPSVVNDILSDSLQPLSEDDLRPMSEAIESMDTASMNLKIRQEAKQAAEKINRVLDKYNRLELLRKAVNLDENQREQQTLEKEEKEQEQIISDYEKRASDLEKQIQDLEIQKPVMEKELESLKKSDAVELKERELNIKSEIEQKEKAFKEKDAQLEKKKEQYAEKEAKRKENENRAYEKKEELINLLEQMQEEAEDMAFQEHEFLNSELKNAFEESFSFQSYLTQLNKTKEKIEQGLAYLKEINLRQGEREELLKKHEKQKRELDFIQRRIHEAENLCIQVQNEWKEKLYTWNGKNQELILETELMKELSGFAEHYDETSDFSKVKQSVSDIRIEKKGILESEIRRKKDLLLKLEEEADILQKELKAWEAHKEPEPVRSESVRKNRQRLKELNIPYQEFYKVVEFGETLDKNTCDRLEEAFLQMGILDALVIDEAYKEQVLAVETGCSDRYLFVKKESVEKSILDVLKLSESVDNIVLNHQIVEILSNISYDGDGITAIAPDGTYRIGALTGTVTGEYEAGFIGVLAREKNRQQKILLCKASISELEEKIELLKKEIGQALVRIEKLLEEYENLPTDTDMREAFHMLQNEQRKEQQLKEEEQRIEIQIKESTEILRELHQNALGIAKQLYMNCNYETFVKADAAVRKYEQLFHQLKSGHEVYLHIAENSRELKERIEDLDFDMDRIRYEMGRTKSEWNRLLAELSSIQEQLKLTDYEKIKERLDYCVNWLRDFAKELTKCIEEKTTCENQRAYKIEEKKKITEKIQIGKERNGYLKKCFEAEMGLAYIKLPEMGEITAGKVRNFLEMEGVSLQKGSVISDLNRIYFENRAFLNDYQLTQSEIFGELEEESWEGAPQARRTDIYARYRGEKIAFGKLLVRLEEDIEELQGLIKTEERELFEDILANTMSRKIRGKINNSNAWVEKMNGLMGAMNTSSGLRLSLRWRSKTAEHEDQLDTKELVDLLKKDYRLMREEEAEQLSRHFRSKVEEARRRAKDSGGMVSFYQVMKETLDYRKWFEFQLFYQKSGERQKELTNSMFGTFSGGEKAMAMYVPLFSAVVAKYQGGNPDAPRLISLDEAFAGVDNRNIRDMFRLMMEFQFDFIINSQVLWGDCDTLDALAIYQLIRPENAKFVTVMSYLWNGKIKEMLESEQELERRASE